MSETIDYLQLIKNELKRAETGYVCSWWIRTHTGIHTNKLNYEFDKLVKQGLLRKEAKQYHFTKYYLIEQK